MFTVRWDFVSEWVMHLMTWSQQRNLLASNGSMVFSDE
jgi:hypothetical protein